MSYILQHKKNNRNADEADLADLRGSKLSLQGFGLECEIPHQTTEPHSAKTDPLHGGHQFANLPICPSVNLPT
jgi:hypothetical protein